jgi:hypothetical protein
LKPIHIQQEYEEECPHNNKLSFELMQMGKGLRFNYLSDEISEATLRAKELCWEYNNAIPRDDKKRQDILDKLLHPESSRRVIIDPTLQVLFGHNLKVA